jgi:hypothetical protein
MAMLRRQFAAALAATTGLGALGLTGCSTLGAPRAAIPPGGAQLLYWGGPILTMNDAQPQVEAVVVHAGRIVALGRRDEVAHWQGAATQVVDLQGRTLIPGFVDPHSHLGGVGLQAIAANLLPPPDGPNTGIAQLQDTLRQYIATSPDARELQMAFGFGYDDSQLAEHRHPTRDELDAVSTRLPIVAIHQSGHFAALNSKALERAHHGRHARSAKRHHPPASGVARARWRAGGKRLLWRTAVPDARAERGPGHPLAGKSQALYLQFGYTTVQDGRADPGGVATAVAAAQQGKFKVDVVSYPDILTLGEGRFMQGPYYSRSYRQHWIGGVKLTLDGSPQGKTAWLTQPYVQPPAGLPRSYAGYGVMSDAQATAQMEKAFAHNWQILVHANGDAAIDQMILAVQAARARYDGAPPMRDRRPVLIHGQTLRHDQVAALRRLGIFPSLFSMHTYYWGDWHRSEVLGEPRAQNISPTGWVLAQGLRFTTHHDAPVVLPSSIRVLDATVNRRTRSGQVLGPEHRVTPWVALQAMTLWAAYQHFEEDHKGSIELGKLADFAVLSGNPLTMPPGQLSQLQVLQTIKEGVVVYQAP